VPAPRRLWAAATASRWLSRAPAANAWSNRSAPSAWRIWSTSAASARRCDGHARKRLRRRVRPPPKVGPHRPGDAGQDLLGPGHPNQRDEDHAGVHADAEPLAHRQGQPGLADPTRPAQGEQPGPFEEPADLAISSSRPTSEVSCTGRFLGLAPRVRGGGKSAGSPSITSW
jgi:hypothetical protein